MLKAYYVISLEYLTADHQKKEKKSKYIKPATSINTNQTTENNTNQESK